MLKMKKLHALAATLFFVVCCNASCLSKNAGFERVDPFDKPYCHTKVALLDSIPITHKPYYDEAMRYIVNDLDIRKGFSFLSEKKINKRKKLKIKVCNKTFLLPTSKKDIPCNLDSLNYIDNSGSFNLFEYSTVTKKYNFVLFFSPLRNSIIECHIVRASNSYLDEDFYLKTRWGRVLNIQFCFRGSEIISTKILRLSAS